MRRVILSVASLGSPVKTLEARRAYSAKWQAEHPEKAREYCANYRARHRERTRLAEAKRRERDRDKILAHGVQWRARYPEKIRENKRKRRARKLNAPGDGVTAKQWRELVDGSLRICPYCNTRSTLEMDHIEPLSRGGSHDTGNAVPACAPCNRSKGNTPLIVWLAYRAKANNIGALV